MDRRYRFVWNMHKEQLVVTCSNDSSIVRFSGLAGRIIKELSESKENKVPDMRVLYPKFTESALNAGWFGLDGKLRGTLRVIEEENHLERIQIEVTTRCNFKCSYCFNQSSPHNEKSISFEKVKDIICSAEDLGVSSIDFTGGEFFTYKRWREVLDFSTNVGIPVSLHTNGYHLVEDKANYFFNNPVQKIQVTVESHIPDIHVKSGRGDVKSFYRVIENIKRMLANDIEVGISMLVHKHNVGSLSKTVEWFKQELGLDVHIDRVIKNGVDGANELGISEGEYWDAVSPLIGVGAKASRVCDSSNVGDNGYASPECGVGHNFMYVTSDGHYSLCPTMTHREEIRFAGPDIYKVSLKDAWLHSKLFNSYRGINCQNINFCEKSKKCGGGCRSNAYISGGSLTSPDLISCNVYKNPGERYIDFMERYSKGDFGQVD